MEHDIKLERLSELMVLYYQTEILHLCELKDLVTGSKNSINSINIRLTSNEVSDLQFRIIKDNEGWIHAPIAKDCFFIKVKELGKKINLFPNASKIKADWQQSRILSSGILSIWSLSFFDEGKPFFYLTNERDKWIKSQLPKDFYLGDVDISKDGTIWLVGAIPKSNTIRDILSPELFETSYYDGDKEAVVFTAFNSYNYSQKHLKLNPIEKIKAKSWLSPFRRSALENFSGVNAETKPVIISSYCWSFEDPYYDYTFFERKNDSFRGKKQYVPPKLVLRIGDNKTYYLTNEGINSISLNNEYSLICTWDSLANNLRAICDGIPEDSYLNYLDFEGDEFSIFLIVSFETMKKERHILATALLCSVDEGRNWNVIKVTYPYLNEPLLCSISLIR